MQSSIFREYDIRGKVGTEFVIEQTYQLGCAIAAYFIQTLPTIKTVALGMDGRTHSPRIEKELRRALLDSGLEVIFVGVCPTPVVYFSLYRLPVQAGLMITASHNPKEYNGIKISLDKSSVWGSKIKEIEALYCAQASVDAPQKGTYSTYPLIDEYVAWLADNFSHLQGLQLPFVIDCGNATGGTVIPQLVHTMKWDRVTVLYPEVDGEYPNHEADPVIEENMVDVQHMITTTNMAFGIGLDGDCDRMAAMTEDGFLIPGDQMLALFANHMRSYTDNLSVVFDIKSSGGLIEILKKWQITPVMAPSGHSIIKEYMERHDAVLGGELSCHFFFKDRYFGYDDGIYALLRLLEIVVATGSTLRDLIAVFPKKVSSPEYRIACVPDEKYSMIEDVKKHLSTRSDVTMITIDGVRATMPYGWGIIRASNTQPKICLRFEADTVEGLILIKRDFFELIKHRFDDHVLKKEIEL